MLKKSYHWLFLSGGASADCSLGITRLLYIDCRGVQSSNVGLVLAVICHLIQAKALVPRASPALCIYAARVMRAYDIVLGSSSTTLSRKPK